MAKPIPPRLHVGRRNTLRYCALRSFETRPSKRSPDERSDIRVFYIDMPPATSLPHIAALMRATCRWPLTPQYPSTAVHGRWFRKGLNPSCALFYFGETKVGGFPLI